MRNHVATHAHLAFIEGRRVDRHQKVRAHLNQLLRRIVLIEPLLPERLVIPEILADGNAELRLIQIEQSALTPRLEITRIVEHVILRQKRLVRETDQLPIANYRSRVE